MSNPNMAREAITQNEMARIIRRNLVVSYRLENGFHRGQVEGVEEAAAEIYALLRAIEEHLPAPVDSLGGVG